MSDKYIIRNCPCFFEENEEANDYTCTWNGTEELACQDCTDCVLKQICKLCKDDYTQFGDKELRYDTLEEIIKLLDIQEAE